MKKGPQTLSEAIRKVEKLQAAQQNNFLTLTLISQPPCQAIMIGVFNAKKSVIWLAIVHTIRCYDCDNYGHVAMDCPDKILPSGTPACCRTDTNNRSRRSSSRHHSHNRHSCHDHRDRSRFSRSRSRPHNHNYRSSSHHDPHRSHSRSFSQIFPLQLLTWQKLQFLLLPSWYTPLQTLISQEHFPGWQQILT